MLCLAAPEKVSALNLKRLKADNKTCGQSQKRKTPLGVSFFVGAAVLLRKIGRLRAGDVGREAGKGIRSAEGYRAGPRQEGAKKHPGGVRLFLLYHCKPQDARGK